MHKIKKFAAEHKREIIFAAIYLLIVVFLQLVLYA